MIIWRKKLWLQTILALETRHAVLLNASDTAADFLSFAVLSSTVSSNLTLSVATLKYLSSLWVSLLAAARLCGRCCCLNANADNGVFYCCLPSWGLSLHRSGKSKQLMWGELKDELKLKCYTLKASVWWLLICGGGFFPCITFISTISMF